MPKQLDYFSETKVCLIQEIKRHDTLMQYLVDAQVDVNNNWPEVLGEVAAYCNVWLEGEYRMMEMEPLYVELLFKLKAKRPLNLNS